MFCIHMTHMDSIGRKERGRGRKFSSSFLQKTEKICKKYPPAVYCKQEGVCMKAIVVPFQVRKTKKKEYSQDKTAAVQLLRQMQVKEDIPFWEVPPVRKEKEKNRRK